MFIKFEFGNFRSFRDKQKFSMEAMPLRPNDNGLSENNVFQEENLRLLKTKAVYGGNASGKSNLAKAIAAFQRMVSRSVAVENLPAEIWNDRFQLITDWDDQPVFFQYFFALDENIYRYGFQIKENTILYEWLFVSSNGHEIEYFMRSPNGLDVSYKEFPAAEYLMQQHEQPDSELFRSDSLYLTAAALNGNRQLAKLRTEIRNIMSVHGVYDTSAMQYAMSGFINGPEVKKKALLDLLAAADTGIEDLVFDELPDHLIDNKLKQEIGEKSDQKVVSLFSFHSVFDGEGKRNRTKVVPFGEWESEGTAKLFGIGALVLDALANGRPIVVDEFDARLHPNLSLKIVELFQDEKTNPDHAQLIFVTHDSGLLRRAELRRDQICLINKDSYGVSTAVNLVEFKGVRKDASYEKEYLNGTYTGIPYLEKVSQVVYSANKKNGLQKTE